MKIKLVTLWLILIAQVAGGVNISIAQTIFRDRQSIGASGLIIPRFVSLSANEANLRTGPGERYPILWVYVRADIPLEVTAEYGAWRRVRDIDGTIGWMHSALLSGNRTGLITETLRTLYAAPDISSAAVLRMEPGVIGAIDECEDGWCRMNFSGRVGWIPQEHLWGTYSNEIIQ